MLFLHDAEQHFEDALRDGYPALAELRAEGVVGAIGAGMYDNGLLTRLVSEADVDVVMLAGRYTLLDQQRAGRPDAGLRASAGCRCSAPSVFNSGLLATPRPAPRTRTTTTSPPRPSCWPRVHRIADVCEAHGVTLPQAAMAFPLLHPVVAGIVLGMRSAGEVAAQPGGVRGRGPGRAVGRPARRGPHRRAGPDASFMITEPGQR